MAPKGKIRLFDNSYLLPVACRVCARRIGQRIVNRGKKRSWSCAASWPYAVAFDRTFWSDALRSLPTMDRCAAVVSVAFCSMSGKRPASAVRRRLFARPFWRRVVLRTTHRLDWCERFLGHASIDIGSAYMHN